MKIFIAAILFLGLAAAHGSPLPFSSRPGAPVTLYITTGIPAEAWFPGVNVPTLPPPAFTDSDLLSIYKYDAGLLANENINVTNVDPVKTLDPIYGWSNSVGAVHADRLVLCASDLSFYPQWTPVTGGFNTTFGYYDPGTILHKPFGDPTGTLLPWDSHTGFVSDRFGLVWAEKDVVHEFLVGLGVVETPGDPTDIMCPIISFDPSGQIISASDYTQLNANTSSGGPQFVPEGSSLALMSCAALWAFRRRRE